MSEARSAASAARSGRRALALLGSACAVACAAVEAPRTFPESSQASGDQSQAAAAVAAVWPASRNNRGSGAWEGEESRGLPTEWSIEQGETRNVVWSAKLGSESYGGPTVAGDLVVMGTNNHRPRAPETAGDRGIVMAFDSRSGEFRWQMVHDKGHPALVAEPGQHGSEAFDWPEQGVCSRPTFYRSADGREWIAYVSNRGELVVLDLGGRPRFIVDMVERYGVVPHFMSASSPLIVGQRLFVLTGNGPDEQGSVKAPRAPSFVAVDADSGEAVWQSSAPTRDGTLYDGQWSSPVFVPARDGGVLDGTIVFPAGDGALYGFSYDGVERFRFDANSTLDPPPQPWQAGVFVGTPVWSELDEGGVLFAAVGRNPEGGASGQGQLLALAVEVDPLDGRQSLREIFRFRDRDLGFALASVVVGEAAVYLGDLNGFLFAIDRQTGEELWRYDARAPIWATPLLADGRIYLADSDGDVTVLTDSRERSVVNEISMDEPVFASPTAWGDTLFVATRSRLWALAEDR